MKKLAPVDGDFGFGRRGPARLRGWPAVDQGQLSQSIGGSEAAQTSYVRGSVGAMVIDVPPDAGSAGSRRSRRLCRTVCLA